MQNLRDFQRELSKFFLCCKTKTLAYGKENKFMIIFKKYTQSSLWRDFIYEPNKKKNILITLFIPILPMRLK
ncbi:hypothetical protein BpHYR1_013532 [Brachionus plicatilis]|uniref:Uncharacterized protein n=1 Tax=Brachionus plicatilis TaxID=10195 RepID=A0A3M7SI32_BRAPC|nr:hypothetical protein BpHYR1_013532 [Brachionus plicatilis]